MKFIGAFPRYGQVNVIQIRKLSYSLCHHQQILPFLILAHRENTYFLIRTVVPVLRCAEKLHDKRNEKRILFPHLSFLRHPHDRSHPHLRRKLPDQPMGHISFQFSVQRTLIIKDSLQSKLHTDQISYDRVDRALPDNNQIRLKLLHPVPDPENRRKAMKKFPVTGQRILSAKHFHIQTVY